MRLEEAASAKLQRSGPAPRSGIPHASR
jgi:hypothetical protein